MGMSAPPGRLARVSVTTFRGLSEIFSGRRTSPYRRTLCAATHCQHAAHKVRRYGAKPSVSGKGVIPSRDPASAGERVEGSLVQHHELSGRGKDPVTHG